MQFIKGIALCWLAVLCATPCGGQYKKKENCGLFPVVQSDKWGYVDRSTTTVASPSIRLTYSAVCTSKP